MPTTPSSTTLHRTREEVLAELDTIQQKDSALGFVVVLFAVLITYGLYATLNEFTDLSWGIVFTVTSIAAVFVLLTLFSLVSAGKHRKNAQRRKTIISRYEQDLLRWMVAHGKNGSLEFQGNILGTQCGVKRVDGPLLEYFTIVDNGSAITLRD